MPNYNNYEQVFGQQRALPAYPSQQPQQVSATRVQPQQPMLPQMPPDPSRAAPGQMHSQNFLNSVALNNSTQAAKQAAYAQSKIGAPPMQAGTKANIPMTDEIARSIWSNNYANQPHAMLPGGGGRGTQSAAENVNQAEFQGKLGEYGVPQRDATTFYGRMQDQRALSPLPVPPAAEAEDPNLAGGYQHGYTPFQGAPLPGYPATTQPASPTSPVPTDRQRVDSYANAPGNMADADARRGAYVVEQGAKADMQSGGYFTGQRLANAQANAIDATAGQSRDLIRENIALRGMDSRERNTNVMADRMGYTRSLGLYETKVKRAQAAYDAAQNTMRSARPNSPEHKAAMQEAEAAKSAMQSAYDAMEAFQGSAGGAGVGGQPQQQQQRQPTTQPSQQAAQQQTHDIPPEYRADPDGTRYGSDSEGGVYEKRNGRLVRVK